MYMPAYFARRALAVALSLCIIAWAVMPATAHLTVQPSGTVNLAEESAGHGHSHDDEQETFWLAHGHAHDVADHDHSLAILIASGSGTALKPVELIRNLGGARRVDAPPYLFDRPPRA